MECHQCKITVPCTMVVEGKHYCGPCVSQLPSSKRYAEARDRLRIKAALERDAGNEARMTAMREGD